MAPSPDKDGGHWGLCSGQGLGVAQFQAWARAGPDQVQVPGVVCLSPPPEGRGPPPGSGGWLSLWGIDTWTWECRVCMGSVSECTTSIVVCLYVGCVGVFLCVLMRVGMCDCDCVCLFLCQAGSWAAPSPGSGHGRTTVDSIL
ncbi:hypothetical protein ATANTOWER_021099 [Ataeniobius toweri]|uniref:Uncharacterized protein n=1 Tax=Ataeniobius toweri TaxID=208326 RepID=A0ABU7B964_9TELE|nr:hypothetical protein [Ataeniobius toweri]